MIPRALEKDLLDRLRQTNKVIIVYGARQVGKTTLVRKVLKSLNGKILEFSADLLTYHEIFSSRDLNKMKSVVSGYDILFIDEAQRIPDIGINLKILHEGMPKLIIIISGSSSLDMANLVSEPLTGRTWTYKLYPISTTEWKDHTGQNEFELQQNFSEWLVYGMYPQTLTLVNHDDKRQYLRELTASYLYKDILEISNIRYPQKIRQLLQLLAYQIGNLISLQELANTLQVNRDTVIHYIDLLEKSFVLFRLSSFSRNLRKEIVSKDKIYFYDLGVRNAVIENFASLDLRNDIGPMWENYLLTERKKKMEYSRGHANMYFWRTYTGAELDYVEEKEGQLAGFEFKWKRKDPRPPKTWLETYQGSTWKVIHRENFGEFVL